MPVFSRFARYVEEVARRGSIRSAAEWLNIAPSAIDRQIINAEEEIGTPLFDRLPQGLRLTAAGEHLVYNLRRWQQEYENVRTEIDDIQGLQRGRITMAVAEALAGDLLSDLLAEFLREFPRMTVTIHVVGKGGVREMVLSGMADIGLTFMSTAYRVMRVEHSVALKLGLAMLPDHPLVARKSLLIEECRNLPLILPDQALLIRGHLDAVVGARGLELNPVAVTNNFALMRSMLFKGVGVPVLTRAEVLSELRAKRLVFVPFADKGLASANLSLVTPSHPSAAASKLARSLVRAMDEMGE